MFLTLQWKWHNNCKQTEKIEAFKKKIALWKVMFQEEAWQVSSYLPWDAGKNALTKAMTAHGAKLQDHFNEYGMMSGYGGGKRHVA